MADEALAGLAKARRGQDSGEGPSGEQAWKVDRGA